MPSWLTRGRRPSLVLMAGGKKPAGSAEKDYQRRLGRVIVELRAIGNVELGPAVSQATLAELLNRSEAALSRWENGKATPSAFDLVEIARIFDAPSDLLIHPPEHAVSPVRQMLAERAAAGARKGQSRPGQERGAA